MVLTAIEQWSRYNPFAVNYQISVAVTTVNLRLYAQTYNQTYSEIPEIGLTLIQRSQQPALPHKDGELILNQFRIIINC